MIRKTLSFVALVLTAAAGGAIGTVLGAAARAAIGF